MSVCLSVCLSVYFNESPIGHCLASVGKDAPNHDGAPKQRTATVVGDWVGVCVCASVRVRTSVHVFAIYDDNILSRRIMIIIKIIILYFIQIRHTDDSPQRVATFFFPTSSDTVII